jgi:predicted dehydrogenase
VLGTARINRHLIPAFRASRRSSLRAVASRDGARATGYAQTWSIPVAHGSYDALLRDTSVDAVYVSLPNSLHVEWTLRALDAGKHVLCEKPLALVPEDIDRIASVALDRQRVAAEAFMYRHEPLIARTMELVREGGIGAVRSIAAGLTFPLSRPADIRLDPSLGGGSLWDIGCYAVNVSRLVAGTEPRDVFGCALRSPNGVDLAFTGLLRFPGDVVATIESRFDVPYRAWLDVTCANGMIRLANPFKPGPHDHLAWWQGEAGRQTRVDGSPLLYVRQIDDFCVSAVEGRPPVVTLADSRGNASALAALHESARRGAPVQLS